MTEPLSSETKTPRLARGVAIAIALTLFSGIAHGYLDGRWSANVDLKTHGEKIKALPESCGSWTLVNEGDLGESAADLLRCYGSTLRDYLDSETGDRVNAAVLFGPRGPTAIHIPEICFDSVGTAQVGDRKMEMIDVNGKPQSFWSVKFSRDENPEPSIEVWYAWSDGSQWMASKYPRFWMTETLYKVQVSGPVGDGKTESPCKKFLTAFLPQLEQIKQRD